MRMFSISSLTLAMIAGLAVTAQAAGPRGYGYGPRDGGFVTAESRFGHGTVSGPVRPARAGHYEVRLPGGTWIACRRSCSETLRVETVDFWENKGAGEANRVDNECGLFGCLGRGFRF